MLLEKILRQTLGACLALASAGAVSCAYEGEQRTTSEEAQIKEEQPPELPERPAEPRRGNIIRRM